MYKRKRSTSLLYVFFLIVLFFLLLVPLLFPALGSPDTQEYDYVDNNTSDVDASPDKGTHSNFTAQQYSRDTVYDTLREENTGGEDWGFTWLDSPIEKTYTTTSEWTELDLSGDVPSSATGVIIAEVSDTRSDLHIVVRGAEDTNNYMSSTSYCEFEDETWRMQIVKLDANRHIQYWSDNTALRLYIMGYTEGSDPKYKTVPVQLPALTADSAWHTISVSGYVDGDSDGVILLGQVTSGSDTTLLVRAAGSTDAMTAREWEEYNIGLLVVKIDANDKFEYYLTSGDLARLFLVAETKGSIDWLDTNRDDMSPTSTGWTMRDLDDYVTVPADVSGAFLQFESAGSWGDYQNIAREYGTSWTFPRFDVGGDQWLMGGSDINDQNQLQIYIENTQEDCYLHAITRKGIGVNYELDLEVQWTSATCNLPNEELCIYGGTMGSESIQVDVWNGSTWHNLFTGLSSGWNNVSVTDYLVSSTFTIRFKGGTETGDTLQDGWEIDCTLLHTWGAAPIANFSYTPEYPYTGETVTFNASESYDPDGAIVSYFWDFGDGTNGTDELTTHTYDDGGTYTVVLTVTDNDGLSDTVSADVTVLNRSPVATFTESAETVYTDETITFNASDSYDPDGTIVSYFWDFGDGTNASGVVVDHAYVDDGNYTVTLTVTDNDGATGTTNAIKSVLNRPPEASFTESAETVYTGETITFNATESYDPDGSIVTYFWDFGDGANATGVVVEHAYADNATYIVTLIVTDDDGASASTSATKTVLNSPPVALFTESAETVYTSEIIYFNASDSYDPDGTMVSYFWEFGDGTNATGITVEHAYTEDGVYTVILTVTDDDGATASTSATKTILNRPPIASFTESAETVYTSETIYFNASDSYDPDGAIVSYFWDFGDGTNATGVTAEHAYADDGTCTVALTVTDDDGATDTITATKTVLNRAPVASFTESAETVYTGETITFNASDSYDSDGVIVNYYWDFGDGTNTTGEIVNHSYGDNGNYTVTLTVTDDDGATASTSATKTILNSPPVALFTESAETVYTSETVMFNAGDSYDPDGSIVSYFWNFGDGTNATGITAEHSYSLEGNYTVTLTVTDDDGATASTNALKTVLNRPPVAIFTETAETVYTGETVTFNASESYDPDGAIVSYFWNFGDGTNATGAVVDHTYDDNGNYTVTLTVTDDDGATGYTYATKTVLNRPPAASFTESAETVLTGEPIIFNASDSHDPDGSVVEYFWDFGDGTNVTGLVVEHAYADNGNYTVTLTVTDNDGATDSASSTKTVLNQPPVASFTESAETVYTGETITFNASDSYDSDGTIVSYFWDFGDGTNASGVIVEHAYANDGNYTVTLTVTDDDDATDSASSTKTVLNRAPVASFTESAETAYTGETIAFNASDSYDPDGSVVEYFWDFGDGTNATDVVVEHSYAEDGNYTVTLTVTDDDGATASASATKTVLNRPPVASFTESAETVYTDETITFNATGSYDPDGVIVSYFWDFGDGTNATGMVVDHAYVDDGNYTVILTVTDDDGGPGTATAIKTVLNRPPMASFTESAETVYTGESITFNATDSYDSDGSIVEYFWDFGDGTNATGNVVGHAYADDGNYTVTLTVTDDDGATNTSSASKTVLNRAPVASFTESTETVYTGETITFNASSSYDPDGVIVSYFWDFGDGTNATGVVVDHAYAEDGNYTVTLTVTDEDDASDTVSTTKTVLNRSPVATFTESAEMIYTGETIRFNASGSYDPDGSIVSYFWDFGDETNATGVVVDHSYAEDRNYTVTLTVTDDDGATASTSTVKTVLNRPPIAIFTETAETVYTGEIVAFNASESYDPDGITVSFFWDFGDGANDSGMLVEHAYLDDGNYTVTLTVTDDDGATASSTATKTVLNRPPVASFVESAETVLTGEPIYFNASASYDSDGTVVSYFWDFGDGTNATGVVVANAYADDGNYTVTLTVTDDDGATDVTTATKTVLNRPPVASFTESAETVYTEVTITFNASASYDPDGTISYFWDFGDGTNATGVIVEHSYVDDGVYNVTLTVTDDDGATDTATSTKTVLNRHPVASFSESAETIYTSEVITFDASASYDPDGAIVSYFWDFGDGTNATGVVVANAYADDGNYTVTLTVTDDDGATDVTTATKTVLNRPPVASFTESAQTVYTEEIIRFNASASYDPDGTVTSYFWDFGDNTNATGIIVEHEYMDDGVYTVTLTVTDNDDATTSTSSTKTVLNRPPVAIFTESATTVLTNEIITFNASESYDPDGSIGSYFWDFGDGANATGIVVDHAYSDDGNYTVTLTITDDDGATDTVSATKTVLNRPPVAAFTESAETVYTGETITFNATDSYDPDGFVVSYFWDFGDGTNTTGVVVYHSYMDDGNYAVTLTVTDDDEATDSATASKTVLNRPPVASFTESAETVLTGETITFNASESYDPDGSIVSYFWDFGDGTNATGVVVEHSYVDDGNYTVTLTVTDEQEASSSTSAIKTILNRPPIASFIESAETVLTGETITFDASYSYDPDGTIVSYFWDFGDGTNRTGVTVGHAYADDGNYTVTLTVTDEDGATANASASKSVLNRSPVAKIIQSATVVYTNKVIHFDASDSNDPDGVIVSYFWDFGDGTNATSVGVDHAYSDDGDYTVTLTVTDDDGATGTATSTTKVLNRGPLAFFTESSETVYTNELITFNASDSYDPDGTIGEYFWDFGDGANTTGEIVGHAYAGHGNYTVTLTITDDDGATSSTSATKTILNHPPIALFTESSESVIVGETIYFNASDSYDPDGSIVNYFWDFGDGTNVTGVTAEHAYNSSGVYTVTLTVTDNDDATGTASAQKTVEVTPPVAIFTESSETVYTNELITFNASDSYDPDGTIVEYFWDFGDGTNATGVTAEHVYADDGNYTVTLTVTDDDGASDSATATKTVLNRAPVASFTESAETVYTSEPITFNASGSYDPDGTIVSYFWGFGDGANATGLVVDHSFADNGNYTVTLTVTDDDGATATATATKTVLNRPPVASFSESAETALTGEPITFNASASYDSDGTIVSYFWDFGDGTNATGVTTEHVYADDGNYTVTLTVTDDDESSASASASKTVLNRPPVASFTESAETVYTGETITLNATDSYDPDGSIVQYFWDFGDGTNGSGIVVEHSYADDTNYTVTLTVTDDNGATETVSATKTVLNRPPVASFTESAETVLTGESITFNASDSYDPDGSIVSYSWDFGDGTNTTGVTVSHVYSDDGNYTVTLTVTDDDGATDSATASKTVLNRSPVASFTESAETVYTGETITFNASDSYDPDGYIVSYFWDFGDGTNATGIIVEHAYAGDGNYTVTLIVTDDDGAIASTIATKTVLNRAPVASFTESAESVVVGEIIYFNASDSYDPDGSIVNYFWDFGDGTNATSVTAEHAYNSSGIYTLTLTVTDNDGATGTASAQKTVEVTPPVAMFTESAETVYTGETITFNASDSYDPDGTIASYFWDFGDGTNATGVTVEHAYADDGNYNVTLTVTDDDGASDSATATKTILNRPPVASFTESAETVLTGETIYFNASESYDLDGTIVSYFWDFGDGTNATGVTVEHAYADDGNYTVTLTVTDDDGPSDTATATKYVRNSPPVAIFTESAETVYTGETVSFDADDSYDPDGIIVSYFWDFGDGTNATGVTVGHAYADDGNYTVTLTVTDDDGATGTASAVKTVLNRAPIASFTQSATTVYTGQKITFDATDSYDPDGAIVSYFWDFGDGTNATGVTVEHAYADDDTYTITLTVTDDDGATGTASGTTKVLNRSPVASFTESAETVYTSENITFNATDSYDPDGAIVSYFWDFGDGTNATGVVVEHAYTDDGDYTVKLTVTDDDSATASTSSTKTILNRAPIALFTESAESVVVDETIYFNASDSYDPDGTIVSYIWDFGDGTNATGVTAEHAYNSSGVYTVTLTVTDNDGATGTASAQKTVEVTPPVAIFTESAETVLTGETIYFNASESYDPDGAIVSYFWDFGDGTNATGVVVEHAYTDDGDYTVTLTITDDDGASDSATATKTIINRPPVAIFTESTETVLTSETITLNASDSYDPDGTIVSYIWDFGDGTNATGVVVEHAYTDDGDYTVTLTITDDDDAIATATANKTVLNRPPIALFTESSESVYTSETITFNASESYDPDGTVVSYFWDFDDGSNATGVVVDHTYAGDGNYTVTLTVTDSDGATDSTSATKTVLNRAPVASFTESTAAVVVGETIYFNASDSYDPDGSIVSYFWDFGDGMNATGVTAEHAYSDDGNYTVTLIVTDDDGATESATATKTVGNTPPVASFTESAETVYTDESVYFNASDSYDPDGYIVSYFWDFGDDSNATGVTVEHAYADDGNYTVTLTVTDDDAASSSTSSTKTVLNRAPVASFTESAETLYTGESITFNGSSSYDSDGSIVEYFWDFGDGTNATGVVVDHAYAEDGNYTVTLTLTDDDGATNSVSATKTVLNCLPAASFTESAETVYTGEPITFNASDSYDPDGVIVIYFWNFGDGANGTGVVVEHAYVDDGNYTVTLTVTDDDGATASTIATKTVLNRSPVASFTESTETVLTSESITFNASDSYDPDGSIVSYFWDFGDGTNATEVVVDHAYADDGNYTVILTVTDDDGTAATATSTKTVLNRPPIAIFTESAESVLTGEAISFNASDSYDPDGYIVEYFWDFGDDTNATGVTVEHAYAENGTYTVTLTITDDDGASDIATATKYVGNSPPVASFTESAETVYTGETVSFDAGDSYDPDGTIVSYFWDFGDGTNATGMTVGHSYADNGNYTVTLTVTDNDDATGTASAVKTALNRAPIASFTQSKTIVYTGELIHFDASDSYDPDGIIVEYFWDFGDGTNATGMTADHAYADDGDYTIVLTLTDDDGATGTASGTTKVLNRAPVASFIESAETIYTNGIITFNASDSYDPDGSIVDYFWDFGDGTNATGITVIHSYAEDGNYTLSLTVTDDDSAIDSASSTKTVLNQAPVATFTESTETAYTGETFTFNASDSYDPDGSIVGYSWDLGDGSNATGVVVDHAYADDGNYTVTLTVTDDDGATGSATATKTVLNRPPVASFTESAETVLTSESITFNASASYDPDGSIVEYFWDFGDGTNATGVTVDHAYADNGNYTVTLMLTDDDGATASISSIKTVLNRSPIAVFTESAETVYVGQVIYFNASDGYDVDGYIVSYFWDFGDGTNATGIIVEYMYETNRTYIVTLTVADDDGATNSASSTKTVLWNDQPVAIFTESAETVYTDETITFNASDSFDPDGTVVSYFWDFGDGTNSTDVIIEHSYLDDGIYTVTLTVTDDREAIGTATADKIVLNKSPVAIFTESAETVYTGEPITFNASDSYDPDGYILEYYWDFGDGTNTTSVVVDHAYADDGNYIVTLTATDDDGATASVSSSKTVLNRSPVAFFIYSPDFPISDETVRFNASDSYDSDGYIANYTWDFGDGNITTSSTPVMIHVYAVEGNYTVILTVTDDDGATDIAEGIIRIRNYPTATFTYSPTYPGEGQPVSFDASSSTPNGGVIVNYTWDFGDENITTTTEPVIIHVYEVAGNYTVTLTVTDSEELSNSQSKTVEVGVPPVASFTHSPTYVFAGDLITFNASGSYDPDGYIVAYTWDFGDENITTVTDLTLTHIYPIGGEFMVQLTVTDNKGISSSAIDTLNVQDYPTADFTWSPSYPIVDAIVLFDASASSPNGGVITSYLWDFGDGTPVLNITNPIITHAFEVVSSYNVTLIVTDSEGLSDIVSKSLKVRDYPTADFTWSPLYPTATETTTFDASMSKANSGTITGYIWDFGDGSPILTTGSPFVEHAYLEAQDYVITLTVVNSEGLSSSITKSLTVLKAPPKPSFIHIPDVPITDQLVTFNASESYDPDGSIVDYVWDFGDGNVTTTADSIITHVYSVIGNYTVTLDVTDNDGLTASIQKTLKVITYPTADFTWSPSTPESSKPVTFNASMSEANAGVIVSYTWNFGDGNTTTTIAPIVTHTYIVRGNYNVTLTVLNSEGLSADKAKEVTVAGSTPEATFDWQPLYPLFNQTVTFDASSSVPNGGVIVLYEWNFGDGSVIELAYIPTITHKYLSYGEYNVTLKVVDNEGLNGITSKVIVVTAPPNASFTWLPQHPQTYEVVEFDGSGSVPNGGSIVSYTWDFGDGNVTTTTGPIISHIYQAAGNYTVTLNVTDSKGLWDVATEIVHVAGAPSPEAYFSYYPEPPYVFETITFNASMSTTSVGTIVSYVWDFGDGNITTMDVPLVTHVYDMEGNYTVMLMIETDIGQNDTTSKLLTVLPICGPAADFTWTPASPSYNKTVTFDASSSSPGWNGTTHPAIVSYVWDFGDGDSMNTTDPIVYHVFSQLGNYTVTLTAISETGQTDTTSEVVEVKAVPWDLNGDGKVDMKDVAIVAKAFGTEPGDPNWNPVADITGPEGVPDGKVDMRDVSLVAKHFGEYV